MLNISRRAAFAALSVVTLAAVPALAESVTITNSKFVYGATPYFRGKAENVRLGSYGEKKTPLGSAPYLAVQSNITAENLAKVTVGIAGPYPIEWSKYSKTDAEGSVAPAYLNNNGVAVTFTHEAAKSANLKLVKFYLNETPLKTLLNNHASGARGFLSNTGSDGRVVSEVWVVMEGTLAEKITNGGTVSGTASTNGFDVTYKVSSTSTTTSKVTIPPNTTFAYLMHKVKSWTDNSKTKIADLEDDRVGLN